MVRKEPSNTANRNRATAHLGQPLAVTKVGRKAFPLGPATQDEIVTTNRLILVLRGKLAYTVEGRTATMNAGTQILVPAWVRRVWSVPRGGPCEIVWCEFDADTIGIEGACFRRILRDAPLAREKQNYRQLLQLWKAPQGHRPWAEIQIESELKTMLSYFWETAVPVLGERKGGALQVVHPNVKASLRWAGEHFHEPDALDALYREAGMSRNYFRRLFADAVQCGPLAYLERLRLRQARYLLRSTDWQLKRISAEVGYRDPLYFSRLYHRFWKRAPSRER